jgi:hypothetical protein
LNAYKTMKPTPNTCEEQLRRSPTKRPDDCLPATIHRIINPHTVGKPTMTRITPRQRKKVGWATWTTSRHLKLWTNTLTLPAFSPQALRAPLPRPRRRSKDFFSLRGGYTEGQAVPAIRLVSKLRSRVLRNKTGPAPGLALPQICDRRKLTSSLKNSQADMAGALSQKPRLAVSASAFCAVREHQLRQSGFALARSRRRCFS